MPSLLSALLVIIAIIIMIVIIIAILKILEYYTNPGFNLSAVGDKCIATKQCSTGLTCDNSVCRIPPGGACDLYADHCAGGVPCVRGQCITFPVDPVDPQGEFIPPVIGTVPSATGSGGATIAYGIGDTGLPIQDGSGVTIYNSTSPFADVSIDGESVYTGFVVDASCTNRNSATALDTGIWILTTDPTALRGLIIFADSTATYSIPVDYQPLSCQAFGTGAAMYCNVLCRNEAGDPLLLRCNFDDNTSSIIIVDVTFPVITTVDTGNPISLGINSTGGMLINMYNGTWTQSGFSWNWTSGNNTNLLYSSYINGKLLTVRYTTFSYGSGASEISGVWSAPDRFPAVQADGTIILTSYWSQDVLQLT